MNGAKSGSLWIKGLSLAQRDHTRRSGLINHMLPHYLADVILAVMLKGPYRPWSLSYQKKDGHT